MPAPTASSLFLSPTESWNMVWGGATHVYNFFGKTGLQPAASVYMANCTVVGGECIGWKASLRSFAVTRVQNGFRVGQFNVGFPGRHILPELLETEYGCRWLGILAVISTITNELNGANDLEHFLNKIASDSTRAFVLNPEQCEIMYGFAREIFFDSPYWYEFLRIASECAKAAKFDVVKHIFPENGSRNPFIASFMMPAFRIWELAKDPQLAGRKIFAKGSSGCAQLILYLSMVCGFHVVLCADGKDIEFGDAKQSVHVVVELARIAHGEWKTGLITEKSSVAQTVTHVLTGEASMDVWMPGKQACAAQHYSNYQIDISNTSSPNISFLLTTTEALKKELRGTGLEAHVSAWMADLLHSLLYRLTVRSNTSWFASEAFTALGGRRRTRTQLTALSERLGTAVELFSTGIVSPDHLSQLLANVRNDVKPDKLAPLKDRLPMVKASLICACELHEGTDQVHCKVDYIDCELRDIAHKIWFSSYVGFNPHFLRNSGPDYLYKMSSQIWQMPEGEEEPEEQIVDLRAMITEIVSWLAGHRHPGPQRDNPLGLAVGGLVVGVLGNESQSIISDSGHCLYIFPGAIDSEKRRIREICEEEGPDVLSEAETFEQRAINDATRPRDCFGSSFLEIRTTPEKDVGVVSAAARTSEGRHIIKTLAAIDAIGVVTLFSGCLGKCASGQLTKKELDKVGVISGHNGWGNSLHEDRKTAVLMAHGNVLIQRAFLPRFRPNCVMLSTSKCVHCAIRAALSEGMELLII